MSYAILINPSAKEVRLTKTDKNFVPSKDITLLSFFGKERSIDNEFYLMNNGEWKTYRGLYVVVGENVDYRLVREIERNIVWCDDEW